MTDLKEWNDSTPVSEISLEQMDKAIKDLREAKDAYQEASNKAKELNAHYRDIEAQVITMLKQSGKKKYILEGIGQVIISEVLSVTTPKGTEQKKAFFDWLRKEMGEDGYLTYATVNSNSLNSLYKQKVEEYGQRGEVLDIDGLDLPTSYTKLSLRKA
jgi:hypothetical protein